MAFWIWAGLLAGAILGALGGGVFAGVIFALAGAAIGAMVGKANARSSQSTVPPMPACGARGAVQGGDTMATPSASDPNVAMLMQRLDAIEARLARIESDLGREASPPPAQPQGPWSASETAAQPEQVVDPSPTSAPDGALEMPPRATQPLADQMRADAMPAVSPGAADVPPPRPAYGGTRGPAAESRKRQPSALSRWLSGGNVLTRVGIVVLFFGVAFLLRYFAEIVTVPIGLKLAAAGAGGVVLAAIGFLLAPRRPGYGLSLQGAGMGIVYLTVFAAFRLYDALAPVPAIALLVLVAATTIGLALRHDSQPLAALALAGGFLAPILIRTDATRPVWLFGYFALLNGVILALAWKRAWRPLNVLGFGFTFALGWLWGHRFYTPTHYATVQPFLILFFVFYVVLAILYARRGPLDAKAPVDGVLVFGVPIVGFALQMAIVRGHRYGVASSALALAAIYAVLWALMRSRTQPGLALLSRAFAALAVIFATLAIPFAVDARATAAWWAVEAAAVYWLGVMQRQPLARGFALLLQLGAGLAFLWELRPVDGRLLLNADFLGMALIGLAAFATVWVGDRHADRLDPRERALSTLLFGWGVGWWIASGVREALRIEDAGRINGALFWVVASTSLGLFVQRWLRWPRVAWIAAALLPAMAVAAAAGLRAAHTTLDHAGWIVWPLAWIVQWAALRAAEPLRGIRGDDPGAPARDDFLRIVHAVSAIALIAWSSWEASEWAGRTTAEGTVWIACAAAIPAVLYLAATVDWRGAARWPFGPYAHAYGASAGTTIAALLFAWFAIVNVVSPGDPSPLPYVPVVNPLDLTLIAALGVMAAWDRAWGRHDDRVRFGWLGGAAFLALNGAVVRTAHHWGDVDWRFAALMAYKPLQVALTLTWTLTALALMLVATRRAVRPLWMVGAALLAVVVVKLFAIDLAALSGLTRVVAFMGVGGLLLVIGYIAPLPPAHAAARTAAGH